jgi:hypothetical protein
MKLNKQDLYILRLIKAGIKNSNALMNRLTEYHGGPITTEYLLTGDIARALLDRFDVGVEVHYKHLINIMNSSVGGKLTFSNTRADVVVRPDVISTPDAVIEIKIGVTRFRKISNDITRIIRYFNALKPGHFQKSLGIVAFQIYSPAHKDWYDEVKVLAKAHKIEDELKRELAKFSLGYPDFHLRWLSFQSKNSGAASRELEGHPGDPSASWGRAGHAIRHHAIIVKRWR